MKDEEIERIDVQAERVAQLLEHAKCVLSEEDYEVLENIVKSFAYLTARLEEKRASVRQLRKLLFGFKSEKLRKVLEGLQEREGKREESTGTEGGAAAEAEASASGAAKDAALTDEGLVAEGGEKEKPKGHGRNGADAYQGAERTEVEHETLKPGAPCPEPGCTGKVYLFVPRKLVRIVGQAPVAARVFEVQQLRCNLCLKVFSAKVPEASGEKKYDPSAASMIALLRYGTGVPMNRLEGLERSFGIPLPASTQWDVVERAAKLVGPAYKELMRQAAQGDVLYNDDTPMKILELMKKKEEGDDGQKTARSG